MELAPEETASPPAWWSRTGVLHARIVNTALRLAGKSLRAWSDISSLATRPATLPGAPPPSVLHGLHRTAVDAHVRVVDEGRALRDEERDRGGDLLGLAAPLLDDAGALLLEEGSIASSKETPFSSARFFIISSVIGVAMKAGATVLTRTPSTASL